MQVVETTRLDAGLAREVRGLLDRAFAGGFHDEDWEHTLGGHHVVVLDGGVPIAHAAVVPRTLEVGGRPVRSGYVEGVATAAASRGRGFGAVAMSRIDTVVRHRYDLGALSTDAHGFYERLGWERWRGPTFVRDGVDRVRTPDEDAGIMVLRFGPSRWLDLGSSLTCEARPGDDW